MKLQPALGDRSAFPDLAPFAYLNHCGVSPPSTWVREAVAASLTDYASHGAGAFPRHIAQRDRLRARLAALIGAAPADIGLSPGTSAGLMDVALCLPWRANDRILCFQGEFPANVTPWQRAAATFDLRLDLLPLEGFADGSGLGLARVEDELRRGARLVAVSAVQFQTGIRMPIEALGELCRRYDAELAVDAIQALGVVPMEHLAPHVDYVVSGGHKWMMGLEGAGFVYAHPARAPALRPVVAGWLSHEDPIRFLFEGAGHLRYDRPIRARADRVEIGVSNAVGCVALEAALGPIAALGVPDIFAHVQRYHDALEAGLLERGYTSYRAEDPSARSGILSVRPRPGQVLAPLQSALAARGIAMSTPDGVLRFGPHWPNALDEVPRVLAALDELAA